MWNQFLCTNNQSKRLTFAIHSHPENPKWPIDFKNFLPHNQTRTASLNERTIARNYNLVSPIPFVYNAIPVLCSVRSWWERKIHPIYLSTPFDEKWCAIKHESVQSVMVFHTPSPPPFPKKREKIKTNFMQVQPCYLKNISTIKLATSFSRNENLHYFNGWL